MCVIPARQGGQLHSVPSVVDLILPNALRLSLMILPIRSRPCVIESNRVSERYRRIIVVIYLFISFAIGSFW